MNYLCAGVQSRLQAAFFENNLDLSIRADCIVVNDSHPCTIEKIQQIIESAKLCPLISRSKIDRNFVFTVSPYKIPDFFNHNSPIPEPELMPAVVESQDLDYVAKEKDPYLTKDEVLRLFDPLTFVSSDETNVKDVLLRINALRSFVSGALNQGLSEIISRYVNSDHPIIEIGSGIGYTLSERISEITVRTQPDKSECQLLSKSISEPIFKTDIEGIHSCLLESGKKIPLFFALNVFDTLSPSARKESFSQISQLQNSDDRILILLDTNPSLSEIVNHIELLYPDHVLFPYTPLTQAPDKMSLVVVPMQIFSEKPASEKPSIEDLVCMFNAESEAAQMGMVSEIQQTLHRLQKKFDFKVIHLEDFFVEQVKSELLQAGYQSDDYYYNSFTVETPSEVVSKCTEDLIYKPVTDTRTVRQWCINDERLLESLAKKGLALPSHFNNKFLPSLRQNGQKIIGAEFLVIDAKKI